MAPSPIQDSSYPHFRRSRTLQDLPCPEQQQSIEASVGPPFQQERSASLPYPVSPTQSEDARPPHVPLRPWGGSGGPAPESPLPQQHRILRKPVSRASVSEASTIRPSRPNSVVASSSSRVGHPIRASLITNTTALFSQASRSLTHLATDETLSPSERPYSGQSPPPYVHPGVPFPGDVKRRISVASSRILQEQDSIFVMIRQNRPGDVQKLLEQGIGVDEEDPSTGKTPIMEAAGLRRIHICQVLITSGARLHLKDHDQNTALHWAAASGDADVCRLLIEAGAQLDEYNRRGKTPIQKAAIGGHTEAIECLLNLWAAQTGNGTALMNGFIDACTSGNISTARAFIDRGVQPAKIKDRWQLVANAASSGSQPMLDFIAAHRVNLRDRDPAGRTALHHAAVRGETSMCMKLLAWKVPWKGQTKKDNETALHMAIAAGKTATAMALIEHKDANVSIKDADSQTPLHHAARTNNLEIVALLLAKGAKLDEVNDYGWNALLLAAAYGHTMLVADLVTRGDNIEVKLGWPDFKPARKTHEAARKSYWAEVRWPHPGARPLHLAIEFGHDDVANILLANGASIDDGDSKQWRPIHYAAFNGRRQIVEHLINRGVSPHVTTAEGRNPMGLGFREPGLAVSREEKEHICEFLHAAMNARKKSKLRALTGGRGADKYESREAAERNRVWHTAQLAAALYQTDVLVDEAESEGALTPTASSQQLILGYAQEAVHAGSSQGAEQM